jgi:septal ring factor EnvC (AmiA/AmiB activator)
MPRTTLFFFNFFLASLLLFSFAAHAQNKIALEEKRKKLTKEIEITSSLLKKTKNNKTAAYDQYVTLQNQIERRESLVQTIENEVIASEENILRNLTIIQSLEQDLEKMKQEYGRLVRNSFRRQFYTSPLLFILSSDNLNQAFRRWLFLRKYNRFRNGQVVAIAATQEMLSKKINSIETEKQEKEALLQEMVGQKSKLQKELEEKNGLLMALINDEGKLRQELKQKQAERAQLDRMIESVISAEIAKKIAKENAQKDVRDNNRKRSTSEESNANSKNLEKVEDLVSNQFKKLRGKLPWPVEGGVIARNFGRQKHPTLKNIEITNNGIDIRSIEEAPVKSIFEGAVAGVQYIPGHDYTVILQHGNYYSVYSNLSETSVNKGDKVNAGAILGKLSTNPISGAAELHFELWQEKERLNPANWIK